MLKYLKIRDTFFKNIVIVFIGASLVNVFNLLFQLLIAHRLTAEEFAAFNSLLAIFVVVSTPLTTLQTAVAKYISEFNARNEIAKARGLLVALCKKTLLYAVITLAAGSYISFYVIGKLKIDSPASTYILGMLFSLSWIAPVLSGGLQGLELFNWLMSISVISGILKLSFAALFIWMGFAIAGALGAYLLSVVIGLGLSIVALKKFLTMENSAETAHLKEIFMYLFPVALSTLCFMVLTNIDIVLVKYYFSPRQAGVYSIAQMVGKIFLFLPSAISLVLFPKTSGLNARKMSASSTLNRSLLYAICLCILANLVYHAVPGPILTILTGKAFPESLALGRWFSLSMSFFALLFILITYFLALKDLRFIKYLVIFTIAQVAAIIFAHHHLTQIQWILCANACILFFIHLALAKFKRQ
jgi:O-antigen/teichoic acid export membrane protein